MYYPAGMKARVSPVQSIEPHRILAPTRDSNQEPLGPQSRVVTTILPLHNYQLYIPGLKPCDNTDTGVHSEISVIKNSALKRVIYTGSIGSGG